MLKTGYTWRVGSGNSSFWYSNWRPLGVLGIKVPFVDIHDIHLTVHDVITNDGQHTQSLYTNLPTVIADTINNTQLSFNSSLEDAFIWSHHKNGTYSANSGYSWLLSQHDLEIQASNSWSWIWKLKVPEKFKFLIWLACHNAVPTLTLLHHRNMVSLAICSRCGDKKKLYFIV